MKEQDSLRSRLVRTWNSGDSTRSEKPSKELWNIKTADVASDGKSFLFGISTSSGLLSKIAASGAYRTTTVQELLDEGFTVTKTGKNGSHFTVGLPNPVTDETTNALNRIFGASAGGP